MLPRWDHEGWPAASSGRGQVQLLRAEVLWGVSQGNSENKTQQAKEMKKKDKTQTNKKPNPPRARRALGGY